MEIPLPPLPEQRRIAKILGDLDDKIELNRKMNETLEQMARALFKSWFVDFDPVRAKMEGRTPTGMDAATAALFPDRLVDSELGLIPEGWEASNLAEIAAVVSGKRAEFRADESSPACSIPLYGGAGPMGYAPSALYEKPILLTGRVGTLGIIHRIDGPSWPSDNTLVVEPKVEYFDFTYFLLESFDLISLNRGSTQPLLTQTDLKILPVVFPPVCVVEAFAKTTKSIFSIIATNNRASRTLSTLRDTLLPKLVGGEVRV